MQDELGWEVVNCYDEPPSPRLRRSGWRKEGVEPRLEMLNPDLPMEAIDGAVEELEILNVGFWILNGRGRRSPASRQNPVLSKTEAHREISQLRPGALKPELGEVSA